MVNYAGEKAAGTPKREYDNRFNASSFADGSVALRKAGALDFLLIHGTAIPCALYTQIISDYEGFVTCRVTQDIYSANGAALLVERGSMVSGTQKVAMELGKARIFTNWADIETPKGVSIRIDSLGTGALGASGHEAWVDNHFAERFGGAILLSFVDDALGALSASASKDSEVQFDNSTKNASDMASKALEASINIAPTGYSYIGQRINILIARDIDMSSVYQFEDAANE
ncbi:type IV secretion system protein VirB10 [Shewanella sp. SP1W3]|uniref:Type IV secretion system protein VirB10 n=2 Tax=Shewanella septentrionalis TaxID=2952223 RepID=A0A9X2WYF7_9GAMM|nr:type IV secretion system protein VirB10 [Shewanella septentrionalis]